MFLAQWWFLIPLVGIPMMLIVMACMMAGMEFMMRMMMGKGGMWPHGPADAPQKPTSDQASDRSLLDIANERFAKERFAKGEITKEEFDRIRGDLA